MRRVVWVLALSACGRFGFDARDAATSDAPADACALGAWTTPALIVELETAADEFSPTISTDSLSLVFSSDRPGGTGNLDLYLATRSDPSAAFDPPEQLAQLNTAGAEQAPSLSFDGLTLYYASNMRLQRATRPSVTSSFGAPTPVSELAAVPMLALELTAAGDELFFTRSSAIHRATYAGGVFTDTGPVTELNVGATCCPTLSHDGLTIYFATDRGGGGTLLDIYSATRPAVGAPFGTATPTGVFSSPFDEDDPDLSDDGRTFVLASSRGTSEALYLSTRSCD